MYREIWSWERCKDKIATLRGRLGFPDEPTLRFLRLRLSLKDGRVYDEIRREFYPEIEPVVYCILCGYADSTPVKESSRPISFRELPGGEQYHSVFERRVTAPLAGLIGRQPELLVESAKLLGGEQADVGDCSARVRPLPLIPVLIVFWEGDEDIRPSVNMFFDSTVVNYLTTEQVVLLCELTSKRIRCCIEEGGWLWP